MPLVPGQLPIIFSLLVILLWAPAVCHLLAASLLPIRRWGLHIGSDLPPRQPSISNVHLTSPAFPI